MSLLDRLPKNLSDRTKMIIFVLLLLASYGIFVTLYFHPFVAVVLALIAYVFALDSYKNSFAMILIKVIPFGFIAYPWIVLVRSGFTHPEGNLGAFVGLVILIPITIAFFVFLALQILIVTGTKVRNHIKARKEQQTKNTS